MPAAKARCPEAASTPTAAEHHKVVAVFRPRTWNPSRRITSPPRNPMPSFEVALALPSGRPLKAATQAFLDLVGEMRPGTGLGR